jgi:hypothetical protein
VSNFFVLASVRPAPRPEPPPPYDTRRFWLESWDGRTVIPLPRDVVRKGAIALRGMLGLGTNPSELITTATPGIAGSRVVDLVQRERPVALPLGWLGDTQAELWAARQAVRDLTDPLRGMTPDGNFRLVCASASGTRQLNLAYQSGLEDEDTEYPGWDQAVISCIAPNPYAEDRAERAVTYRLSQPLIPFLAAAGTDAPWGTRQLVGSRIADENTRVEMASAVPVYPTIEVTGPADSVLITSDAGLRIDVPDGIPGGSTLRIVTDPRHKSIRLDGALAAGSLARGSRLVPFPLGTSAISVSAPGADESTALRLSWRGLHRELW